jgi:hypothetical protein
MEATGRAKRRARRAARPLADPRSLRLCFALHGHARSRLDALPHVAAPERGESSLDEKVATAKRLELVGPANHRSVAIRRKRPLSTHAMNESP